MRRWARTLTVVWRLTPFLVAFLRDRRSWLLFGAPARRTAEHHSRRAEKLTKRLEEDLGIVSHREYPEDASAGNVIELSEEGRVDLG